MMPSPHQPSGRWAVAAVTACGLAALAATAGVAGETRFAFLATGLWALTIMLSPLAISGERDLFSIWSFAMLSVIIGVTIRGACLTFGHPDTGRLDELYFLGREPAFFLRPAVVLLTGLAMLALGYVARRTGTGRVKPPPCDGGRMRVVCLALLAVSAVATVLYIRGTGGWDTGDWSGKRTPIPGADLAGTGYESHGGLRFLASLAIYGHVLALAAVYGRQPGRAGWRALAGATLLVACVVPFYASLRTTLALQICVPAAMHYYLGRRFAVGTAVIAAAVMLGGVYVMTGLRPVADDRDANLAAPTLARVFDSAVLNRNQIDLPKTAHIVSAVPHDLPLAYGRTMLRWMLAPIPRALWPGKPVITPGPIIGRTLYDQPVAGVPPSLVAELFWNFHWPGVVIGCFGLGMLLRWLQTRFHAVRGGDPVRAALYVAGPMTVGFEAVGSSIGSGLFKAGLQTATMLAILYLIRNRRNE